MIANIYIVKGNHANLTLELELDYVILYKRFNDFMLSKYFVILGHGPQK